MTKKNRLQDLLRSELSIFRSEFKSEMVNYIGPIFEEVKTKIHGQTILMEQMDKKINTALEAASSVLDYEQDVGNLDHRVGLLETDVKVIKLVLKNDKSWPKIPFTVDSIEHIFKLHPNGALAKRLGSALQKRLEQFDSVRHLQITEHKVRAER